MLSNFLWDSKKSRIHFQSLVKPKTLGGLAYPNFQLYYEVSQLVLLFYILKNDWNVQIQPLL